MKNWYLILTIFWLMNSYLSSAQIGRPITLKVRIIEEKDRKTKMVTNIHRKYIFYIDGDKNEYRPGFLGLQLAKCVSSSPDAYKLMHKYKNVSIAKIGCDIIFCPSAILAFLSFQPNPIKEKLGKTGQISCISLAILSFAGDFIFNRIKDKYINLSVKTYNESLLSNSSFIKFNKIKPDYISASIANNEIIQGKLVDFKMGWYLFK